MDRTAKKDDKRPSDPPHTLYDEGNPESALKLSLYEVLFQLFHLKRVGAKNVMYKKIEFILSNIFQSFQMVGILVTVQDIKDWGSYSLVWNAFQLIRVDHLAAEMDVFRQVSFTVQTVLLVQLVFFLLLVLAVNFKKMPPNFIFIFLRISLFFTVFVFRVPAQILIQSLVLFPISNLYSEGWTENIPFAVLAMGTYIFLYLAGLIAFSDIRHLKENISGRSCSHLEISTFIVRFAAISYFVYKGSSDRIYLCVIVIIGECYLIHQCIIHQYYYSHFANQVKTLANVIVLSSALAVMVGEFADSAGACILMLVLVTPSLSAVILCSMPNHSQRKPCVRNLKLLIENPQGFPTFLDFEKAMRSFFLSGLTEHRNLVLEATSVYFRASHKNKSSYLVVWETNYCLEALKNKRLARIKLTKRLIADYSLEGDFQAFVLRKHINHSEIEYFKEIDYLQFRQKLHDVKEKDAGLCKNSLELMEELTDVNPNTSIVHKLIMNMSLQLQDVDSICNLLCTAYRKNKEVFDLYRTFLIDIMRDEEKARMLIEKYGQIVEEPSNCIEYFDSTNAVMIVSGNYKDLGLIIYSNERLAQLLQEPELLGRPLSELIAPPLSSIYHELLEHHLYNCKGTKIGVPKFMYMFNSSGFILEFYIKVKCIALNSYPVFLLILKPKNKSRELAIHDEYGIVKCHTNGLATALQLRQTRITGLNIEELLQEYGECEWQYSCSYYILNEFRAYYSEKKVHSVTIRMYKFYKHSQKILRKFAIKSDSFERVIVTCKTSREKSDTKRIQLMGNSDFLSNGDNEEDQNAKIKQESENERKKILSLLDLPTRAIKLISICLWCLVLTIAFLTISQSIYVLNGLDSRAIFESFRNVYELKYNFVKIANEARMLDLIDFQPSFSQHIVPFQNFVNYNNHLIDFLTSCNSENTLFDKNVAYWDGSQLKHVNLVDFSNMFAVNGFEYFEKREMTTSYKFIVTNSRSFPYEYMKDVLDSVKYSIEKTEERYAFIVNLMVVVCCAIIGVTIAISTFLAFRLRNWAMKYWKLFQKFMSENYLNIQSVYVNRLEIVHGYKEVKEMYRPFKKAKWTKPYISIYRYIWRNVLLCILILAYYPFVSSYYLNSLNSTLNNRVELAIDLGESTVQTQELNFWTREMMYEGSLESLLADLYPLRDVQDEFSRTHKHIDRLFRIFLKRETIELTNGEIGTFYDKTEYEGIYFMGGLYGQIKLLLLDSKFYAFAEGNTDSMYKKFAEQLLKADECQESFFKQSLDNSVDLIEEAKNWMVMRNFLFLLFILTVSFCLFVPFIREERDMIQHKHMVIQIIRFRDNYTRY